VSTDQGKMEIQKIIPGEHTINNKKVIHITETTLLDDKLVCIKKNAFRASVPNKDTYMSGFHKVNYNGVVYEAYKLVGLLKKVKFVKYNNETLYNVLLEEHDFMKVQNLTAETLNPENIIAKLYNTKLSPAQRQVIVDELNVASKFEDVEKALTISKKLA